MIGGEIKVVLNMDDNDFSIKVEKAGRTLKEMKTAVESTATATKNIERHLSSFGDGLTQLTFKISVARFMLRDLNDIVLALPRSIIESVSGIEKMTVMLKGLSKEIEESKKNAEALRNTKFIFDLSQKTPFSAQSISDSFVKLKTVGIDPTRGALQALADETAKFGGNGETLKRATLAIQQMVGKGVVSMEELRRQLSEAIPNATELMATGLGMSVAKLTKIVSTGGVEASNAVKQMMTVMSFESAGAGKQMMETWDGMIEQMKAKWTLLAADMGGGDNGLFATSKAYFKEFLEAFDDPKVKEGARTIGGVFTTVITGMAEGIKFIREYSGLIKQVAEFALIYKVAMQAMKIGEGIKGVVGGGASDSARELRSAAETKLMEKKRQAAFELTEEIKLNNQKIEQARNAMAQEIATVQAGENEKLQIQRKAAAQNLAFKKEQLKEAEAQLLREQERQAEMLRGAKGGSKEELAKWKDSAQAEIQSLDERIAKNRAVAVERGAIEAQQTQELGAMVAKRTELEARYTVFLASESTKRESINLGHKRTIEQTAVAQAAAEVARKAEQAALESQIGTLNAVISAKERDVVATRAQISASQQNVQIYGQWAQNATERLRILNLSGTAEDRIANAINATSNVTRGNIERVKALIAARRDDISQAQAHLAATARATAATVAEASAVSQVRAAHEANIAAMARANAVLTATAAQTAQVTLGVRLLSGAMAGAQTIFNAFGGWVGIALTALTYLGTKLYDFLNRWERAKKIADEIKGGMAPDEDKLQSLMDRKSELEGRVNRGNQLIGSEYTKNRPEELKRIKATLEQDKTELDAIKNEIAKGTELADDARASHLARGEAKNNEMWMAQHNAATQAKLATIKENAKKEQDAAKTSAQRETIASELPAKLNSAMQDAAREEVEYWQKKTDAAKTVFEKYKGAVSLESRKAQAIFSDATNGLEQANRKLADALDLGKFVAAKGKDGAAHLERENPLVRLAEKAQADWEVAKLKLKGLQSDEAVTLEELKRQSTMELIGKIIHGDFDYVDQKGKTTHYMDLGGRKKLIDDFLAFMKEGKGTADDFVRSLKFLKGENQDAALTFVSASAKIALNTKEMSALQKATELAAVAHSEMTATQDALANNAKTNDGVVALAKQFDKIAASVREAGENIEEFDQKRRAAMADATATAVMKFSHGADDDSKKADDITNGDSSDAKLNAALVKREEALRKLDEQVRSNKKLVDDNTADQANKIEQVTAIEKKAAAQRKLIWAEYYNSTKTPMQRLRVDWQDTTTAMNNATAKWAGSFMDEFTKMAETGKFAWKNLIKSMLQDIYQMQIKKMIGNKVTDAFESLGSSIAGALGFGKVKAKGVGAAGPAGDRSEEEVGEEATDAIADGAGEDLSDSPAAKSMFEGIGDKFSGLLGSVKEGFSAVTGEIGNMFSGVIKWIADGIASVFASSSGGGAGGIGGLIAGAFGGKSGGAAGADPDVTVDPDTGASFDWNAFADGGVMTSQGRLPLRKYAAGGVANFAQAAIFGEGSRPEAFVPLPDGRTIPVTMRGGGQAQPIIQPPSVVVNVINQSGQAVGAQSQNQRFDGKQMILDVVLTASNQPGPFRDGMKSAMR